ncbi:MAG: flagellar biosynthesis anti-sigma factor FlgM [Sterolibacterium sp.]|jgi:negative regulator of flagellin synthesis FlgM|nr:flagellar biosynthesis anti-sigma factor FlgM [Sterolibacterium sp.]
MKIDNSVKPLDALVGGARKEAARPASSRSAAGQGDAVALSPLSARLQEMEAAMAASPVVDADRVSAIRQAISAGTFKVDTSKIADGLLASVQQMLSGQK